MNLIENIEELQEKFQKYNYTKYITNNYLMLESYKLLIERKIIFYEIINGNLFLYEDKGEYYKVYYYIKENNNINEIKYKVKPQVLELLYRGQENEPQKEIDMLEKFGFEMYLKRHMLTARNDEIKSINENCIAINVKFADNNNEIEYTKNIFDKTFDKYTGDILSLGEINNCAINKCLICAYFNNELSGALQFYIKNNIAWIGHVAVSENFRGQGVAKCLVNYYIEINKSNTTKYNLWVLSHNKAALTLYNNYGFKYAGKSTISMIKYN